MNLLRPLPWSSSSSSSTPSSYSSHDTAPQRKFHLNEVNEDISNNSIIETSDSERQQKDNVTKASLSNHDNKKKLHTMTVCMVPDPKHLNVWTALTKARTELRDPGLFRWPPHANILYPFYDIQSKEDDGNLSIDEETLSLLSDAVGKCEPFTISLHNFGTFGGNKRGVLYVCPSSFRGDEKKKSEGDNCCDSHEEPLVKLHSLLQACMPECHDQKKNGKYTPHITLSHFKTLDDAIEGQRKIESWWKPLEFDVREIYCLKRIGDDGQFKILATLPLGQSSVGPQVFSELSPFPTMPLIEEDWVRQERMALKARRNGNGSRNNKQKYTTNRKKKRAGGERGPSRSRDSPEEIAKKRAERALKRDRLAREVADIEAAIQLDDINN